jgi:hypothetical protein
MANRWGCGNPSARVRPLLTNLRGELRHLPLVGRRGGAFREAGGSVVLIDRTMVALQALHRVDTPAACPHRGW